MLLRPDAFKLHQAHLADLQRESDALHTAADDQPLYAPAMQGLGKMMVKAGEGLQQRYGDFIATEMLPPNTTASSAP